MESSVSETEDTIAFGNEARGHIDPVIKAVAPLEIQRNVDSVLTKGVTENSILMFIMHYQAVNKNNRARVGCRELAGPVVPSWV